VVIGVGAVGLGVVGLDRHSDSGLAWGAPGARLSGRIPGQGGGSAGTPVVMLSAVGDIVLGSAPDHLPDTAGGFFDQVSGAVDSDLAMGNLEMSLTDDTGVDTCGAAQETSLVPAAGGSACEGLRLPPEYAGTLRAGGFDLLNMANDHSNDFGSSGYRNTQRALAAEEIQHTGAPDEVTVVEVAGVKVAVVGFSPYSWSNSLLRLDEARDVVRRAATLADLVVVQAHMGAEGPSRAHVKPGEERFQGQDRGDPVAFSHAVIEAGADLVIGHGPKVLRPMEFYRGRLIAYSLGNFAAGGGAVDSAGGLGIGGVLSVSLASDGSFQAGRFLSTVMRDGRPVLDPRQTGGAQLAALTRADFPRTGMRFDGRGGLQRPVG